MKKYPMVLFAILFISGLALNRIIIFPQVIFTAIFLSTIVYSLIHVKKNPGNHKHETNPGSDILIYLCIFLLGNIYYKPPVTNPLHNEINKEDIVVYGSVTERGIGSTLSFTVESDSLQYNNKTYFYNGTFYCRIKERTKADPHPGNFICLKGLFIKGRETRNPGEFDYADYLNKIGVDGYIYSSPEDLKIVYSGKSWFQDAIYNTRKYMSDVIERYHQENISSLLKGLILADRSEIGKDVQEDFVNTGTAHVLAVSGLNAAYIILMIIFLTGRMNLYLRYIFICLGMAAFALVCGGSAAVLRAAYMVIIVSTAYITNRSTNVYNSLAVSAIFILITDPVQLFLPGFILTYVSILAIIIIYPLISEAAEHFNIKSAVLKKVILYSSVSISAQIGTFPVIFYYFSKLSLVAVFTNLVVIPIIGIITGAAFVTIIFAPIIPFIASVFAAANGVFTNFLLYFEKITGNPSFSFLWIRHFTLIDLVIFYLVLVFFIFFIKKVNTITRKIIFTVLCTGLVIIGTSAGDKDFFDKNFLNCYTIDVGQGDAILLQFPGGETALIDAGETTTTFDTGERIILPLMQKLGIEKIDNAFISHLDSDHYSGMLHLLKSGYIRKLFLPPADTNSRSIKFEKFISQIAVPVHHYAGDILKISGAGIYFLDNRSFKTSKSSSNDLSGVMLLCYGKTRFLFTGDAGLKAEDYYLHKYSSFLKADVLKISHHGSKYSTSEEYLNVVNPSLSLISAGEKNKFGHPSEIVLDRLKKTGSRICRTDKDGGILLQSDGLNVKFINWKEKEEI